MVPFSLAATIESTIPTMAQTNAVENWGFSLKGYGKKARLTVESAYLIARLDSGQPSGEPWPALTLPRISTPLSSSLKTPVTAGSVNKLQDPGRTARHTSTDDDSQKDLRDISDPCGSRAIHQPRLDGSNKDQES